MIRNVVLLIAFFFLIQMVILLFIRIFARKLMEERLNLRFFTATDIYLSAHDIDIVHDRYRSIRTNRDIDKAIGEGCKSAKEALYHSMGNLATNEYREMMQDFVNLDTLGERLGTNNNIIAEYRSRLDKWCRGRFVVSDRSPQGEVTRVLWLVEDIDREKRIREAEKRRNEELQDISARAVAANEAKTAFLSNMSHEIRTPINAILGMNEMVLRECHDENILSYSERIQTAGNTLLDIVNGILDFSKIEAGKMEIVPVEYNLSAVLNELVDMIRTKADKKGLEFKTEFDSQMPKLLFGDEIRIKQVITNILTNACKYTEKGRIIFSAGYEKIPDDAEHILLNVSVRDTGIGIKKEDMEKLFSEFDRIEEKRNRSIEGTGLGMNITQSLLEMMGSTLQVQSEYGKGSEFSFSLKQKVIGWEPVGNCEDVYKKSGEAREKYKEKFIAPDAKILVVDDMEMNLVVFESLLKQTEIQIETAKSADEGIAAAAGEKYDLIFLDHMMPDKDGVEALKELQAMPGHPNVHTPVICLTANAISGAREKYLSMGFDDYITKPINAEKLEELLLSYLPEEKLKSGREKQQLDIEKQPVTREQTASEETGAVPERYRELKEINAETGIHNCGSAEAYQSVLDMFYDSVDDRRKEIETYYQSGDRDAYMVKVHALKTSVQIIGAAEFGDRLQQMEDAGKEGDTAYIREHHGELIEELVEMKNRLAGVYMGKTEKTEGKKLREADAGFVDKLFRKAFVAAEMMDIGALEEALEEIGEYRLEGKDKEFFETALKKADAFDYDGVVKVLSDRN